jgi:hypothetical protein
MTLLRSSGRLAGSDCARVLRTIASAVFAIAVGALPATAQDQGIDYIFPGELDRSAPPVVALTDGPAADGDQVSYRAFNGQQHTLRMYQGSHVVFLLPDSWLPPSGLSEAERRLAIDRADHLYVMNTILLGAEPRDIHTFDDKLVIAVVPTCGAGCGYVGTRGIELAPDTYNINDMRSSRDAPPPVLIHEMNHNFDIFYAHHSYVPDAAHAWTFMMDAAVPGFLRLAPAVATAPERLVQYLRYARLSDYITNPDATWQACLSGDQIKCPYGFNALWGAVSLHTFMIDGLGVFPGVLTHFRTWASANAPGTTPQDKGDLHVSALSAATNADLGCYVDGWKWWASPTVRSAMASRGASPKCLDQDGDGSRPFDGDPDDHDPARHPGAPELINNLDDDGDGAVDESRFIEPSDGDFATDLPVGTAAEIEGAIAANESADSFRLTVPVAGRYTFSLEAHGTFTGWLFLYEQNGSSRQYIYVDRASAMHVDLPAGSWRFSVSRYSAPGPYTVRAYPVPPAPPRWGRTTLAASPGTGVYRLTAITDQPAGFAQPPTEVRFWISGYGFVGSKPWNASVSFDWALPAQEGHRPLIARAQPFRAGLPVADVTPPTELSMVAAPTDFAATVAGNSVTFSWSPGPGLLVPTSYEIVGGGASGSTSASLNVGAGPQATLQLPTGSFFARLHALHGTQRSAASNELRIFVNVPGPPAPPSNLLRTINGHSVTMAWQLQASDAVLGLWADVSGPLSATLPLPPTEAVTFTGVPPGSYTVRLRAFNATGTSPQSSPLTLDVPGSCEGPPLAPVNFSATVQGNTVTVGWTLPPSGTAPSSFVLHVRGALALDVPITTRSLISAAPPGTYALSVSAIGACGSSPATSTQTVVVP